MNIEGLNYDLPDHLIAQTPAQRRTDARLMVLNRSEGRLEHRRFGDLGEYLREGDCLVLNDTRVLPARFYLQRATGGIIEGLYLQTDENGLWRVLLKGAGRLKSAEPLHFIRTDGSLCHDMPAMLAVQNDGEGMWCLRPEATVAAEEILDVCGVPPLPPYIHRRRNDERLTDLDRQRYQTVFARFAGSAAAPTAGLHFTPELLENLSAAGVKLAYITLHVGLGTFRPIAVERVEDHDIHAEWCCLSEEAAATINLTCAAGGRIIPVGTTAVRTLESMAQEERVKAGSGWTKLFIYPGYTFKIIDAMVTNFHLPKSSLLALVCALAGVDRIMEAYACAVEQQYRFFSYGDAMLIL